MHAYSAAYLPSPASIPPGWLRARATILAPAVRRLRRTHACHLPLPRCFQAVAVAAAAEGDDSPAVTQQPEQQQTAAATTSEQPASSRFQCCVHDVLHATAADGTDWWLEVLPFDAHPARPAQQAKQRQQQKQKQRQRAAPAAAPAAGPVPPGRLRVSSRGVVYCAEVQGQGDLLLKPQGMKHLACSLCSSLQCVEQN